MKKVFFIFSIMAILFLSGCTEEQSVDFCGKIDSVNKMSLDEAIEIANLSECVAEGTLGETSVCNSSSGTWWIDLELEKEGCAPACVVNTETRTAEINWRCTGLIMQDEKNGPMVEKIIFKQIASENVLESIASGEIDYYLDSVNANNEIESNNEVELVKAYSTLQGILLNPAPSTENNLNPFSNQKARFAMQFLLDRDSIAEKVHKGLGKKVVMNIFENHPMYEKSLEEVAKLSIEFDKEKGEKLLSEAMIEQGAEKIDGKWMFGGDVISLKLINLEYIEEMKQIGDIFTKLLEEEGFDVETTYLTREDDNPTYYSNPADLEWNITPISWIYYGISRYVEPSFPEIYEKEGWWTHENAEKTLLEKKLNEENFANSSEWEKIAWELAQVDLEDSVGIWVSQQQNAFAKNPTLQNTTEDNFVGLRNYLTVRKASIPGSDTLNIGLPETHRKGDAWNPQVIMGINMMDITNTLHDPAIWSNPKTLEREGFRLNFEIESNETGISIPSDAFVWNLNEKKWVVVDDNAMAKSKVSYDLSNYIGSKWHDGTEIEWSDILFFTASLWERSSNEKKIAIDKVAKGTKNLVDEISGMKINGNTLEVYLNKSSFDAGQLVSFGRTLQRLAPWEIYAGADKLVFEDKTFSYSKETSYEENAKPLSLIEKEDCEALIKALKAIDFQNIKPMFEAQGVEYSSKEELNTRIVALENWFNEKKHLIISDGPFFLEKYDSETGEIELRAFREGYPINWKNWGQ